MTKQEVKDEYKDTEGKPEVKGRVRQMQRELAQRRMMAEVPNADVIVVNPEHHAVAIKYDVKRSAAPLLSLKVLMMLHLKSVRWQGHTILPSFQRRRWLERFITPLSLISRSPKVYLLRSLKYSLMYSSYVSIKRAWP